MPFGVCFFLVSGFSLWTNGGTRDRKVELRLGSDDGKEEGRK